MYGKLHAQGELLAAIFLIHVKGPLQKKPSQKEVPTYAKACVDVLERHLVRDHAATISEAAVEAPVNTIKRALDRGMLNMMENDIKAALVFCFCPNISFRTADLQKLCDGPHKGGRI
jgi:hypothetical protein